jgi:hypothetical protein
MVMSSCVEVNFLKGGLGVAEGEVNLCQGEAIEQLRIWVVRKYRRAKSQED